MNTLVPTLFAIVAYIIATTQICIGPSHSSWLRKLCGKRGFIIFGGIGLLLHATVLAQEIFTPAGLNLGFFNAVSLTAWVIVLMLLFAIFSKPVENLALVLLPVAALSMALAELLPSAMLLSKNKPVGFQLHLVSSILAYSLLSLATLQAMFLWLQDYQLRHKHPGKVMQFLPPLQVMEDLLMQSVVMGFILLSFSVFSGALFLEDMFKQHVVHHTLLAIAAWLVFALLLWGRWRYGWRGRTVIRRTLLGFFILMLAWFGSKFVIEWIIGR
jgi:ABC-type uncharacterized transport system permease subunit